jgi:hypothetical protein
MRKIIGIAKKDNSAALLHAGLPMNESASADKTSSVVKVKNEPATPSSQSCAPSSDHEVSTENVRPVPGNGLLRIIRTKL